MPRVCPDALSPHPSAEKLVHALLCPGTVTLVVPVLPAQPKWLESRCPLSLADSTSQSLRTCSHSCSDPPDCAPWTSWFSVDVPCSAHQCRPASAFERGSDDWSVALDHWVPTRQLANITSCWGLGKMMSNYRTPSLFYQGHNAINMGPLPLVTMLS